MCLYQNRVGFQTYAYNNIFGFGCEKTNSCTLATQFHASDPLPQGWTLSQPCFAPTPTRMNPPINTDVSPSRIGHIRGVQPWLSVSEAQESGQKEVVLFLVPFGLPTRQRYMEMKNYSTQDIPEHNTTIFIFLNTVLTVSLTFFTWA